MPYGLTPSLPFFRSIWFCGILAEIEKNDIEPFTW